MSRPSARPRMIEAALRVVEERGVTGLTLDATAEAAGVTKRGLIYHFPSKHALLTGVHEELAARIERELLDTTGKEPEAASLVERTRGYVRVALRTSSKAEIRLVTEAIGEPEWTAPWVRVYRRWFPEIEKSVEELDELELRCLVARMAADGAWSYESALPAPLAPPDRARLVEGILVLLDGPRE